MAIMPRPALLLAVGLALAPGAARAEVAEHPFAPYHQQQLVGLDDFTLDTDWFPPDAALQLRLIVHAGNSVTIEMPGTAGYDWDAEAVGFTGTPGAGSFGVDIGVTLDAKVRFDVLGLQWESDIIGPYDYAVISMAEFTPYLLPGNPERPVAIDDTTDPVTFVSVPIVPDIVVAAGNLDIDAYVSVQASLAGEAIEVSTPTPGPPITVTVEGQPEPLDPGPGPEDLSTDGTLVCALTTTPTVVLKPTLVMEILGQEFEVADIEIPVTLPPFDDLVRFDPLPLVFPRPPAPADPTTGGAEATSAADGGDSAGDGASDGASDGPSGSGEDDGEAPTGSGGAASGEASGEGSGTAGVGDDEGCGCRSDGGAPLLAVGLLGLRRRRRG
jgi:MYXO-CTERM domain-containing protein